MLASVGKEHGIEKLCAEESEERVLRIWCLFPFLTMESVAEDPAPTSALSQYPWQLECDGRSPEPQEEGPPKGRRRLGQGYWKRGRRERKRRRRRPQQIPKGLMKSW